MEKTFGEWDSKSFQAKLNRHSKFYFLTAFVEEQAVGFKLGYERTGQEFYSWLGGVLPEYQGVGIASDLMKKQHQWCLQNGYQKNSNQVTKSISQNASAQSSIWF